MLYIANKKTGKKICVVDNRDKGLELIRLFIENDKDHEHYEERQYDVVDYNGTSMI